jgi:hypothetical protein
MYSAKMITNRYTTAVMLIARYHHSPPHNLSVLRRAELQYSRIVKLIIRVICILRATSVHGPGGPSAADAARPVQFRTAEHTEAPGSSILTELRTDGPRVQIPRGGLGQPRKVVALTIQIAPDRLWTVAATQAREAAVDAGYHVNAVRNIGKGDDFGLPVGRRSPAQAALNAMTLQQLVQTAQSRPTPNAYNCIGRTDDTFVRRTEPDWAQLSPHARDCVLVKSQQSFVVKDKKRVAKDSAGLPAKRCSSS